MNSQSIKHIPTKANIKYLFYKSDNLAYTYISGDYLYVAVKRQLAGGAKVTFPHLELLEVDVPEAVATSYNLPAIFSDSDARQYPLFDSSGKVNTLPLI